MSSHLSSSLLLDGYRLIRFLGQGGFGEVWLCQSEAMGDYRALKFIPGGNSDRLEKEYEALLHYRKAAARLRSPHLVPIEHVNRNKDGLYYVMPLADGIGADDPADPAWQPLSLATMIHHRAGSAAWFSSNEIISLMLPVLEAMQTLSDTGLVHRDVKPDNILLFHGQPCLGDISLLGADASVITRRGTPGYGTPSWYVGGHPDMYGIAATLFTLLTGNLPDRMGRAAFLWPPLGETSLPESERTEWKRLHSVIRRATDENVAERYVDFKTMAEALQPGSATPPTPIPVKSRHRLLKVSGVTVLIMIACIYGLSRQPPAGSTTAVEDQQESVSGAAVEVARLPDAPPSPKKFKMVDAGGRFESLREKIIDQLGVIIATRTSEEPAPKRLDPSAYGRGLAIIRAFKERDYSKCLEALDTKLAADGVTTPEPEAVLFRCLLLNKLGREDESQSELRKLATRSKGQITGGGDTIRRLRARLVLWEALGGYKEGAENVSEAISAGLGNPGASEAGSLEQLYHMRARMLVLAGDFRAALADERAAIDLPLAHTTAGTLLKTLHYTEAQALQTHLNTMVMQWELLEHEFPAYASYLADAGSPEPQPDRRDLRDED